MSHAEDASPPAAPRGLHPPGRGGGPGVGPRPAARRDPLPARAQRLPPHRPREGDLHRLRHRRGLRRPHEPAVRRHEPHEGGAGVRRRHQGGHPLARASTGASTSYYASDYFEQLYAWAVELVEEGPRLRRRPDRRTRSGRPAARRPRPGRPRPTATGASRRTSTSSSACKAASSRTARRVLRAKIDMAAPNINLRDPVMYRILHAHHHRTGRHVVHLPDVRLGPRPERLARGRDALALRHSTSRTTGRSTTGSSRSWASSPRRQIEFARGNITYTITSKRKLIRLVQEGHVNGWDDPRMPTLSGLRRRGYTPVAIRAFWDKVGIAKRDNVHRRGAPRALPARRPEPDHCAARDGGARPAQGRAHQLPGGRRASTSRRSTTRRTRRPGRARCRSPASSTSSASDFMEDPPRKFFRLAPGPRGASARRPTS